MEEAEHYKKALFAILHLSYETDQDLFVDIITDTLGGFDLMERYEEAAALGKKAFEEMQK